MINEPRLDARSASEADRQKRHTSSLFRTSKISVRYSWQPKLAADVVGPPTHAFALPKIAAVCEIQPADISTLTELEPAWLWDKFVLEALFPEPAFAVFNLWGSV